MAWVLFFFLVSVESPDEARSKSNILAVDGALACYSVSWFIA